MTLILTALQEAAVTQATDRRTSTTKLVNGVETCVPYDDRANKNVIAFLPDALVSIVFTGLAFLDDMPTDEWISQTITGEPYPRLNGQLISQHGVPPAAAKPFPTALELVRRIRRDLRPAMGNRGKVQGVYNHGCRILIQGWRYGSDPFRPLSIDVFKPTRRADTVVGFSRPSVRGRIGITYLPAANFSDEDARKLHGRLKGGEQTYPALSRELASTIAGVSELNPWVGPDAISIALPNPASWPPQAVVRYYTAQWRTEMFGMDVKPSAAPFLAAYSPWIIAPEVRFSPMTFRAQSYEIDVGVGSVLLSVPDFQQQSGGPIMAFQPTIRRRLGDGPSAAGELPPM